MGKADHFEYILTAIDFMEANLKEPINVRDVCAQVSLSPWQFQRLFRALCSESIGGYLRSRRLTVAAEEILDSKARILDVAIDFQFGSQEAFTRAFKSQFQIAPAQMRDKSEAWRRFKKPRLKKESLLHIQTGIQREPLLIRLGPLQLVGVQTTITSFLGEDPDFETKLPPFWLSFVQRARELQIYDQGDKYGIAISRSEQMLEEEIIYFAGVAPRSGIAIPEGMVTFDLEEKLYAVFENVGLADKSLETINYVYGTWLPQSEYRRARGFDFEIFDDRYDLEIPDSVSRYFIPIEK